MLCLEIGPGNEKKPGWFSIDSDPKTKPTYVSSLPKFPDEVLRRKWDVIEMIHMIGYLHIHDVPGVLSTLYGMLNVNGRLVIETPNLLYAAKVLSGQISAPNNNYPGQYDMWVLYGQPNENKSYLYKWSYTPDSLTKLVRDAGFTKISQAPAIYHEPIRDFRIEAEK